MRASDLLARAGGVLMLGVFAINVYIGIYDSNLSQLSPLHWDLNWVIAVVDLVAAAILFANPGGIIWKSLAGVVWPVVYIANLFIDVETRLCLGSPASTCSPTVSDAYQYLILGSTNQEWDLWSYTIRLAITLVIIVLILVGLALYLGARGKIPATSTGEVDRCHRRVTSKSTTGRNQTSPFIKRTIVSCT